MILGQLDRAASRRRGLRYLTSYATVSSEWQLFFEDMNFHRLVLSSDDLDEFRIIVARRLNGPENFIESSKYGFVCPCLHIHW